MPSLKPGDTLPGFRIEEFVGAGATSEVYRATSLASATPAAIKLLHPAWQSVTAVRARFEKEGQVLLNLQHPHLIRALSVGSAPDELPFLALEWAPNDLRKQLETSRGGVPILVALRLIGQVADALCMLHTYGLIHRDLKPANILLTSLNLQDAHAKLADLGLIKHLPGTHTDSPTALSLSRVSTARGTRLGTWEYMAPELWIDAKNAYPKSDVYGLGCLLFHLVTGQPPYTVADEHALMFHHCFEPPPLDALSTLCPGRLVDLIAAMIAKKTDDRPLMIDVHCELTRVMLR